MYLLITAFVLTVVCWGQALAKPPKGSMFELIIKIFNFGIIKAVFDNIIHQVSAVLLRPLLEWDIGEDRPTPIASFPSLTRAKNTAAVPAMTMTECTGVTQLMATGVTAVMTAHSIMM